MKLLMHRSAWVDLKGIILNGKNTMSKHVLNDSIYKTFWKWQNYIGQSQISGYSGRSGCGYKRILRKTFVAMELFCILIAVVVTQIRTGTQMTQISTQTL